MKLTHIDRILQAFRALLAARMAPEGLPLLFIAIDAMAQVHSGGTGKMGDRFIRFCKDYIDLYGLKLDAHDLWGSRCGLLHAWSSVSDLSVKGQAKELFYYWGTARRDVLSAAIFEHGKNAIPVSIEALAEAVASAAQRLEVDIDSNSRLRSLWEAHKDKTLIQIPLHNGLPDADAGQS